MMATVILRGSSSIDTNITIDTPAKADILDFARILYQRLGSLTNAKQLRLTVEDENNYSKLIKLLDEYSQYIDEPEFKEANTVVAQIDEYLGELGNTKFYPYSEDIQYQPLNIDLLKPNEIREVWVFNSNNIPVDNVVTNGTNQVVRVDKD